MKKPLPFLIYVLLILISCNNHKTNELYGKQFVTVCKINNSTILHQISFNQPDTAYLTYTDIYYNPIDFVYFKHSDTASYTIENNILNLTIKNKTYQYKLIDKMIFTGNLPSDTSVNIYSFTDQSISYNIIDSLRKLDEVSYDSIYLNEDFKAKRASCIKNVYNGYITCQYEENGVKTAASMEQFIIKNNDDFEHFRMRIITDLPDNKIVNDTLFTTQIDFHKDMLIVFIRNDGEDNLVELINIKEHTTPPVIIASYNEKDIKKQTKVYKDIGNYTVFQVQRIDRLFRFVIIM